MNHSVSKAVIDSLGGIVDTIKPLEQSLYAHEMRPFEVMPNYIEDLHKSKSKISPGEAKRNNHNFG